MIWSAKSVLLVLVELLQGVALTKVPKIKFLIVIGGAKFKASSVAENAYSSPIQCPSLHFLGTFVVCLFVFFLVGTNVGCFLIYLSIYILSYLI